MRTSATMCALLGVCVISVSGQQQRETQPTAPKPLPDVQTIVSRLNLEGYKATIKGLTQFGDRRQGTERNRKAVDWIEAQLKSYGCPTGRIIYQHPAVSTTAGGGGGGRGAAAAAGLGRTAGRTPHVCLVFEPGPWGSEAGDRLARRDALFNRILRRRCVSQIPAGAGVQSGLRRVTRFFS